MHEYDVIIIGGGASGLMLAAVLRPGRGVILEKTSRVGTKLLLSGGGRCNITHGGTARSMTDVYGPAGPRLRKALYRHNNAELAAWLEDNGIPLADEKGTPVYSGRLYDPGDNAGRIFPASMKASDVLELLLRKARENGWEIRTDTEVYDITDDLSVRCTPADELRARHVVVASGGITFPETGSDGSMLEIIRRLGVRITEPRSALAPVYIENYPYEELSGISLSDVTVTVSCHTGQTKPVRMTGDLLFTHRGFSGPVILNISRYAQSGGTVSICYNRELEDLPRRLQRVLEKRSMGPSGDIRTKTLEALLSADAFTIESVDEHGMVTAGGISLDDIDMSTMRIRSITGNSSGRADLSNKNHPDEPGGEAFMYAVGEAIDADGITGGYNLQMCWSTALTAADAVRSDLAGQ